VERELVNVTLSNILSCTCLAATIAVVWWGVAAPTTERAQSGATSAPTTRVATPQLDLARFEPLWSRSFQGSPPAAEVATPPAVNLRLVGTIVDGTRSAAIVTDSAGVTRWCAVDETIDNLKLVRVDRDSAEFSGAAGTVVLQREGMGAP
jgi:hypothetical protein